MTLTADYTQRVSERETVKQDYCLGSFTQQMNECFPADAILEE